MSRLIRVHTLKYGFTHIVNNIFREKGLSLKAKGLYCLMCSLPDNWQFSVDGLAALVTDQRDSVRSAMNELEEFRYLIRLGQTREAGRLASADYELHEVPDPSPLEDFTSTVKDEQLTTKGSTTNNKFFREREGDTESNEGTGVTESACAKEKPVKHKHGQFKNVLLTQEEFGKLNAQFVDASDRIEDASLYLKAKGDHYKSHYAMILNWARLDKKRAAASSPAPRRRVAEIDDY